MTQSAPSMVAQRRMVSMIGSSPVIAAQRQRVDAIHNSPRVVQRQQQADALTGAPTAVSAAVPTSRANHTGLPDHLKSGIEQLSGISMDGVRVHYNSSKPAQLQAHAYAQGQEIHLGPGQERHLPHEAWHVVQQAQGRVRPMVQMKGGVSVNVDTGLEREADVMGAKALQFQGGGLAGQDAAEPHQFKGAAPDGVVQCNLGALVLAGHASGAFGNFFGTSTFEDIRAKLRQYQAAADDAQKLRLLHEMQTLGQKWLSDNQKKTDANDEVKRTGIRQLLSLVKQELATRDDTAQYFKEAKAFEHRLGLYLFNFPAATTAAQQALSKMSDVMGVTADNTKAANVFGGDDVKYAGNVGKDVATVMDVINRGNLRERMTAFYNASLGPFKGMIEHHIRLSGPMAGQTWANARTSLTGMGIAAAGVNEIEARKNEIADYPNRFGYSLAKRFDTGGKLLDVYKAAGDRFTRSEDDALLRGQKGVFESEGRDEAFNIGAFSSDAFNFNFDAFDFTRADLQGVPSGTVRTTYANIGQQLDTFLTATSATEKLSSYNAMQSLSYTWLKDNADKTDANAQLKRASLQTLQTALRKVYSGSARTPADLRSGALNADLSSREQEFIMSRSPVHSLPDYSEGTDIQRLFGAAPRVFDDTQRLPWEEGGTRFTASLRNEWVKEAVQTLKMPVVAGPSGTTDRMLQALKFLGIWGNPVSPDAFRLSLLGWMLTSNDHSFHEIMAVSQSFGLSYRPGPYAYHHIPPLTIEQIRENVCVGQNFPDEIVYQRLWPNFELVSNELATGGAPMTTHGRLLAAPATSPLAARLSPIAAASIALYTGGAYLVENPAREGGMLASTKIGAHVNEKAELRGVKARMDAGQVSVSDLQAEAAIHNPILDNALQDLPDFAGRTYRGQADFLRASYAVGDTHTFQKFTSSSKRPEEAIKFMRTGTFKTPVFVRLDVIHGKDVSELSRYRSEQEVLLRAGATFRVTQVEPDINDNSDNVPGPLRPYTRITMQEL
ncbi:hypothetical protein AB870_26420 [Pandoraea faecigallinarum]|uniref:eCIS core domain-containing protein n=1 Tax=Pandoraea faecigallinarum TaxID=656179 RepID=UPI001F1CAB0E|nr:DUF4157 domain-containing protein [Pandoraea faecigallinarum]AOX47830.1 hypothetical protein AB870_26420 [Pandoraea faecigallinarum]